MIPVFIFLEVPHQIPRIITSNLFTSVMNIILFNNNKFIMKRKKNYVI